MAIVRLSGKDSLEIALSRFVRKGKILTAENITPNKMYYGEFKDSDDKTIDDVMLTYFKDPHSYTGEDSVEIVCHGSPYIQNKILEILIKSGARLAKGGEYTDDFEQRRVVLAYKDPAGHIHLVIRKEIGPDDLARSHGGGILLAH